MAFHPFTTTAMFALLLLVVANLSFVAADQLHCEMSLEFKTLEEKETTLMDVPDLNLLRYGILHLLSGSFDQTAGANNWITSSQFQSYQLEESQEDIILIPDDDFDDEDSDEDSEETNHEDPQHRKLRHGSSQWTNDLPYSSRLTKDLPRPSPCWYLPELRKWACTKNFFDNQFRRPKDFFDIRAEILADRFKTKKPSYDNWRPTPYNNNDNDDNNSRRGLRHYADYMKNPPKGMPERFKDPRCLLDTKCFSAKLEAESWNNKYWMNSLVDVGVLCNLCKDDDDDDYNQRRKAVKRKYAMRRRVQCQLYGNCKGKRKLTVDHFARGLVGEEHMGIALNSTDLHTKFEESVCNGLHLFTDDFPTFESSMDCKINFHCMNVDDLDDDEDIEEDEDFGEDEMVVVDNRDFHHRRDLGGDSSTSNITLYSISAP